MDNDSIGFRIVALAASVPEGIPMEWQGRELASGPLTIELDESSQGEGNRGLLDYAQWRAQADFRVRITFPELTSALEDLGLDPALTQPVHAVLHSEGEILKDHSFALSGRCELRPHELFLPDETQAAVLPGR
jgi:hypothetical protein